MNTPDRPKAPGLAVTSLICGLFGFLTCFITGIPAIITGHLAQSKIKQSGGTLGGQGIALAGTILGYITTAAAILMIPLAALTTPAVVKALERANQAHNISSAKTIHTALTLYAADHSGNFPSKLSELSISEPSTLNYKQGKTTTPWTYIPGLRNTDNDLIILVGPMSQADNKRLILYVNGSITPIDETAAQAAAKKQGLTLP